MTTSTTWGDRDLAIEISWSEDTFPHLTRLTTSEGLNVAFSDPTPLVEIVSVTSGHVHANNRLVQTRIGQSLRYVSHTSEESADFRVLKLEMQSVEFGVKVEFTVRAPRTVSALQTRVVVTNLAAEPLTLRSATSLVWPFGYSVDGAQHSSAQFDDWHLLSGRSDWLAEGRFRRRRLRGDDFPRLAHQLTGHHPRGAHTTISTGTWSTGTHLPVGAVLSESQGIAWFWQIEHNGAWRWEVGENTADGYVALAGPTEIDHAFSLSLATGEAFESVPVALAAGRDLTKAVANMTAYRRSSRRCHPDNTTRRVVFNDYMNTLNGDPTTEKLLPLIEAAASIGAEVFCIDAGWYDDSGNWWDSVGEWLPSKTRFPGGLGVVIDHVRAHGMVPGIWLEPESVGIESPVANSLPADAFFQRAGQRIVEHDRYHLDFRHPAAVAHLDGVVDRLVSEFGIGFFKLDYNINPGAGTDVGSPSTGAGLLAHNRAHLDWIDAVLDRHPGLILENCASGGMRTDFALLSRMQLQSTSDQQDFLNYPPIAASAPLSMLPEQAASWAYPQPSMDLEDIAFCLATGILGRFYLSGYLNRMSQEQRALVREAVAAHRSIRAALGESTPFWPLGLPDWDSPWVALGLAAPETHLITLWHRDAGESEATLSLPFLAGKEVSVRTVFPVTLESWSFHWDVEQGTLTVRNPRHRTGARTIALDVVAP